MPCPKAPPHILVLPAETPPRHHQDKSSITTSPEGDSSLAFPAWPGDDDCTSILQLHAQAAGSCVDASRMQTTWRDSRDDLLTWLVDAFEQHGYWDAWLASAITLLDRAWTEPPCSRSPREAPAETWALAAALVALKMSEAEAVRDECVRTMVMKEIGRNIVQMSGSNMRQLWQDVVDTEQVLLRLLDYRVGSPTALDMTERLSRSLMLRARGTSWPGMQMIKRSDLRFAPPAQSMLELLATFLVELAMFHAVQIAYGARMTPSMLAFATLWLSLHSCGDPPSAMVQTWQAECRKLLTLEEVAQLSDVAENLFRLWSKPPPVSPIVRKWDNRAVNLPQVPGWFPAICVAEEIENTAEVKADNPHKGEADSTIGKGVTAMAHAQKTRELDGTDHYMANASSSSLIGPVDKSPRVEPDSSGTSAVHFDEGKKAERMCDENSDADSGDIRFASRKAKWRRSVLVLESPRSISDQSTSVGLPTGIATVRSLSEGGSAESVSRAIASRESTSKVMGESDQSCSLQPFKRLRRAPVQDESPSVGQPIRTTAASSKSEGSLKDAGGIEADTDVEDIVQLPQPHQRQQKQHRSPVLKENVPPSMLSAHMITAVEDNVQFAEWQLCPLPSARETTQSTSQFSADAKKALEDSVRSHRRALLKRRTFQPFRCLGRRDDGGQKLQQVEQAGQVNAKTNLYLGEAAMQVPELIPRAEHEEQSQDISTCLLHQHVEPSLHEKENNNRCFNAADEKPSLTWSSTTGGQASNKSSYTSMSIFERGAAQEAWHVGAQPRSLSSSSSALPPALNLPDVGAAMMDGSANHRDGAFCLSGYWRAGSWSDVDEHPFEWRSLLSTRSSDGPPSGAYTGHFDVIKKSVTKRFEEERLELRYTRNNEGGYNIGGSGSNKLIEAFEIRGFLTNTNQLRIVKSVVQCTVGAACKAKLDALTDKPLKRLRKVKCEPLIGQPFGRAGRILTRSLPESATAPTIDDFCAGQLAQSCDDRSHCDYSQLSLDMPPTLEERVRARPAGCSKCRKQPGCTPSCWKERARKAPKSIV